MMLLLSIHKLIRFVLLAAILSTPDFARAGLAYYSADLTELFRSKHSVSVDAKRALTEQPTDAEIAKQIDQLKAKLANPPAGESKWQFEADLATLSFRLHGVTVAADTINELQRIEADVRGEYRIAKNLAFLFEFAGDTTQALLWVEEALARKPRLQPGSEWAHLLILRAKERRAADPSNTESVLGAQFGTSAAPQWPKIPDLRAWVDRVRYALFIQLRDRLVFEKPPSTVTGDLLFDLGNIAALSTNDASALAMWELAFLYGTSQDTLVNERIAFIKNRPKVSSTGSSPWVLIAGVSILIFSFLALYLRMKQLRLAKVKRH